MKTYAGGFIYLPTTKEILLHLRDAKTENNPNSWAFFGGLSNKGEQPEKTFIREMNEELGVKVNNPEYLRDYFNPDFETNRFVYFLKLNSKFDFILNEGKDAAWFKLNDSFGLNLSKRTREDLLFFKSKISDIA